MATIESESMIRVKHPDQFFIDGAWVRASTKATLDLISPNSEECFLQVAEGKESDIDLAVSAARQAFDEGPWPRLTPFERAALVRALAARLRDRIDELAYVHTEQMGALAATAQRGAATAIARFDYYADLAETHVWTEDRSDNGPTALVVKEAVGVVAMITAWNGPLALLSSKLAPALVAGCTAVIKPSPETPLEAYILTECAEAVGFPPGVINLVCAQREVSEYLVRHGGVDKVSFTGSTAAGRRIAAVCGERIARVSLELGGKSAAIILDDADPAAVARSLTTSTCMLSGQICAALTRVIVSHGQHDELVDALAEGFRAVRIGHSRDPESQLGPLSMKRQLDRVQGYIAKGISEGATLVTGGSRPKDLNRGYFIEPTLFSNVDNAASIAQEEIFAPVISVIKYEDEADAVRIANESIYGLNGSVFTDDTERAYALTRKIRTGSISQNGYRINPNMPFGGFKQSGIGRENGIEGLELYLEKKVISLDRRPANW